MPDEIPKIIINSAGLPYYSLPHVIIDSTDQEANPANVMPGENGPVG